MAALAAVSDETSGPMIDRREILEAASSFSLLPNVVEKDYVLGWILAGIYAHEELAETWIFKGGTCLKKCYFETYRFSEDLDFTLNEEHLDEEFLQTLFEEVVTWVTDQSGLNIAADQLEFDIYDNPRGRPNCQGKIAYRGPVSPTSGGWPKIKLDLTADDLLQDVGIFAIGRIQNERSGRRRHPLTQRRHRRFNVLPHGRLDGHGVPTFDSVDDRRVVVARSHLLVGKLQPQTHVRLDDGMQAGNLRDQILDRAAPRRRHLGKERARRGLPALPGPLTVARRLVELLATPP